MNRKIYFYLFLASALKLAACQFGCNVNEFFSETVNLCNSCEIRSWCPQFGPGCDCFPGYFRNSFGICVPPEACDGPPAYPETSVNREVVQQRPRCQNRDEIFTDCGSACPPTCENRNPVCATVCVTGCFCRPGYVRNRQSECIPQDQCRREFKVVEPSRCGPNEEFLSCGSACPPSCDTRGGSKGPCTQQCVPGCFCKRGFVRKDGRCVRPSECGAPSSIGPRSFGYSPPPPIYPPPVPPPPIYPPPVPPQPPLGAYPPKPLPPLPPAYPPPLPPLPPALPPPLPPLRPPALPPPLPPLRPPAYPPAFPPPKLPPPVVPPADGRGCPNRNKCNKYCKSGGFTIGFCVGDGFAKCSCLS